MIGARAARPSVMQRCLLVLLTAFSVLILPLGGSAGRLPAAELQPLEIASKTGVHVFAVELASTAEEQAKGLMFRRRSEEHTSELQSPCNLVCRLLLEKKKKP